MSTQSYNYALRALVRREHSVFELRQKMQCKEFDEIEIEEALQTLRAQKYQSDERFAESLVNTRVCQGKGELLIVRELSGHQIEQPEHFTDDIDFYELCEKVKLKKFGTEKTKDLKKQQKQVRFLQMRGFNFDAINSVIK